MSLFLSHPAESERQSNILIDSSGNPCLTDFGLSSVTNSVSTHGKCSIRWRAPELLVLSTRARDQDKDKPATPTEKSDVYSLAMVAIEVTFPRLTHSSFSSDLPAP